MVEKFFNQHSFPSREIERFASRFKGGGGGGGESFIQQNMEHFTGLKFKPIISFIHRSRNIETKLK